MDFSSAERMFATHGVLGVLEETGSGRGLSVDDEDESASEPASVRMTLGGVKGVGRTTPPVAAATVAGVDAADAAAVTAAGVFGDSAASRPPALASAMNGEDMGRGWEFCPGTTERAGSVLMVFFSPGPASAAGIGDGDAFPTLSFCTCAI